MRLIILSLFILGVGLSGPCFASQSFSLKYDFQFWKSSKAYLPSVDWRLLKAQCYQESRLKADAVSPVGAMGLCQFMPGTWAEVEDDLNFPPDASAFAPDLSIEAAAFYMARLRGMWSSPRPEADRHSLALASYNAGAGHLLKAQALCGGGNLYAEIIRCLPDVTGRHSTETITYVDRIWGYWTRLVIGGG